jgi:hypothetical protein
MALMIAPMKVKIFRPSFYSFKRIWRLGLQNSIVRLSLLLYLEISKE